MAPTEPQCQADDPLDRYSRQILCDKIGLAGQRRLADSRVVLIGCGALGSVLANSLVRAGVGFLRIVDRDFIELNNLQRQILFDEDDVAGNLPKAQAAREKLGRINSSVEIEAVVADANSANIESLADRMDLILDGTDNFETRYLINDVSVKHRIPWIYGACIGSTGLCMVILPGETPCLRCVFESPPPPEVNPTCDTAGVLGPVVELVAATQMIEALKLLTGRREELNRSLVNIDAWTSQFTHVDVQSAYDSGDCACCKHKRFDYLEGRLGSTATTLCGRDAVQINPQPGAKVDLEAMARKLAAVAVRPPTHNRFMLRARFSDGEIALFPDGRAIIKGTDNPDQARALYAKYVGA